jgi:hypothetical protein
MTRFAKHKKEKKSIGEDATPWEELKESGNEVDKRKEEKRLEKQRKRQLKKVLLWSNTEKKNIKSILDLFSMSNTWTFNE